MQAVSLGDTVTVAEAAERLLPAGGGHLPAGGEGRTLEQRAADAVFGRLGRPVPGLEVRLAKRVPAYAGLGGGSADVAAVLRCLRTLYAPELPRAGAGEIGLAVGSDVPFCVRGGTCLAEGRGEVPDGPAASAGLCPSCCASRTSACPRRSCLRGWSGRPWAGRILTAMAAALARGDLAAVAASLENVFERVLTEKKGEDIRAIKDRPAGLRRPGCGHERLRPRGIRPF